jgi:hypothetical protein
VSDSPGTILTADVAYLTSKPCSRSSHVDLAAELSFCPLLVIMVFRLVRQPATWTSRPYRALIGSVLNADVLLAGRRFGGQSAGMAGGDTVGAPRCGGCVEYVVETGVAGATELVG